MFRICFLLIPVKINLVHLPPHALLAHVHQSLKFQLTLPFPHYTLEIYYTLVGQQCIWNHSRGNLFSILVYSFFSGRGPFRLLSTLHRKENLPFPIPFPYRFLLEVLWSKPGEWSCLETHFLRTERQKQEQERCGLPCWLTCGAVQKPSRKHPRALRDGGDGVWCAGNLASVCTASSVRALAPPPVWWEARQPPSCSCTAGRAADQPAGGPPARPQG